ncbi:MAG: histone deacetylase family protein [Actinobacteria bacterium]|nr:histone deacetylase family protein [Actinomycetota bacterium]
MHVVYTPAHLRHDPHVEFETSTAHSPFEHIGRAETIRETLQADGSFPFRAPDEWGTAPIEAIHDPGLLRFLTTAWAEYQAANGDHREVTPDFFYSSDLRNKMSPPTEPPSINGRMGYWCFETTTPLTEGTYEAARGAVDTALTTTKLVLDGERYAYGLCRPPGHHATSRRYGGYCFFNNAAIAAHHVAATTGTKVTILDVDYHHGNGTQEIFYDRDDVQYVSLHGDPARAYPYSIGYADETGTGRGLGLNLNMPMPLRADDDTYLAGLATACDAISAFGPSTLIVSLGLDTFFTDPISDLAVTTDGFERCGALVAELGLPTVVLQEGGYDVSALGENVRRWLVGLRGS